MCVCVILVRRYLLFTNRNTATNDDLKPAIATTLVTHFFCFQDVRWKTAGLILRGGRGVGGGANPVFCRRPRRGRHIVPTAYFRRFSVIIIIICTLHVLTRRESVTIRRRSVTIGRVRRSAGGGNDLSVVGGGGGGGSSETGGLFGPTRHRRQRRSVRVKRFSSERTTVLVAHTV